MFGSGLFTENLRQALGVVRSHRMRSGLLILGVAIGIMTIHMMVTVMSGLVNKVNSDLESSSKPYIYLTRFDFFSVDDENRHELMRRKNITPQDALAVKAECEGVDEVCYFITRNQPFVLYGNGEHTPPIELDGAGTTMPTMFSFPIEHGRFFTERELHNKERVVVLGYGPARDLFPHENPIGKTVTTEGKRYRVIGTFADRKHFVGSISNNFAAIPYTAYHRDFQTDNDDPGMAANMKEGYTLDQGVEQVTNLMRVRRGVRPGAENNFHIVTSTAFLETVSQVTVAISGVLIIIASIGLIVGGIGVMNIMLISVAERTREIGVRMALGANKRDIIQQFLMESATLTGIGGIIGTALGLVFALLVTSQINFPFEFSLPWTVTAILFSALIGIIFGIYPARRASNLDPVEALRYE